MGTETPAESRDGPWKPSGKPKSSRVDPWCESQRKAMMDPEIPAESKESRSDEGGKSFLPPSLFRPLKTNKDEKCTFFIFFISTRLLTYQLYSVTGQSQY